jgi:hypothetical protein
MVQGELAASTIVRNSTVSGNGGTTGGIHALDGPTVTIRNSIVANSTDPASTSTSVDLANDGSSSFHVAFSNVEAPGTSAITSGGGNLVSQDPNLGPLQNNGGPTETMMPNQGSPVIDAGDPAFSSPPSEDQRGFTRVVGGVLDMGAVEFAPPPGAGTLALTSATYVGGENAGSIVVTVKRTGGSTGAVSVGYATSDGSATAGADYTVAGGTLSWTAGQSTPKAFSIPITNDSIFEGDEILTVTLSNVTGGASLGTSQAEVTIDEDEATPTLTINDVLLPEGNSGTTTFAFTVTLAPSSASVVTVNFATAPGSAGAGDYIAGTGTLSFAAGVTAQVVNVAVLGDGVGEYNETFTVGLNSPTNATIADETGVGTIQNDDPPAMPGSFSATATATNVVTLVWTASPGATSYVVERQTSSAGSFGSIASPTTNGYADTLVSAATTYRYRVRALNAYGSSSITSPDLATTVLFTDSVLSGVQAKAVHLAELRAGVNAVRAFSGRAPASFTGGAAGQAIGAIHLTEVRSALDAAAPDAGLATGGYTDSSLAGVAVKAVHFEEIRSRVK